MIFQRPVLRFAFLWLLAASILPMPGVRAETDEELLLKLQTRSREIQRAILQEDDPARTAELQREMMALMDDILAKVSPPTRIMLELGVKVGRPIMEDANAYVEKAAEFMEVAFDTASWRNEGRLAELRGHLETLQKLNDALLASIGNVEERARTIIGGADLPEQEKDGFLRGFMEPLNKQIGPMRAMRTLDARTYDEMGKLYALLEAHTDDWSVTEDGTIEWETDENEAAFTAIIDQIQVYSERQQNAAAVMEERL